jgi:hypothetical protein
VQQLESWFQVPTSHHFRLSSDLSTFLLLGRRKYINGRNPITRERANVADTQLYIVIDGYNAIILVTQLNHHYHYYGHQQLFAFGTKLFHSHRLSLTPDKSKAILIGCKVRYRNEGTVHSVSSIDRHHCSLQKLASHTQQHDVV